MKVVEYKKIIKLPLKPRTITFLLKDNKVLLGYKKKGFGKGYWLGIGGKVEASESIENAAIREVKEEINVDLSELNHVGVLNFYFPHVKDESWNQEVHVFIVTTWEGKPEESEEIMPKWIDKNKIPYDQMWDDAHYYLPLILDGKNLEADFIFNENLKVVDQSIRTL